MSSKITNKIVSMVIALATIISLSGSVAFVSVANAQTSTTIQQLLDQIAQLQSQLLALQGGTSSPSATCAFSGSLTVGSRGSEVTCLQNYLKGAGFFSVTATGYFGNITKASVASWQAANGVSPAVGYFGSISRAKYSSLAATSVTPPTTTPGTTTPPPAPAGSGLTVSAGAQPTGGLHPDNAVRVPYTTVVFTASSDGDVTVNSVTAERRGPSTDATFSGVELLDEHMTQLGLSKTLNSAHQAILSEPFVVKAGTSRTMYIGADRTTSGTNGTQASFALVAVSTAARVNGSLPIVGSTYTVNVSGLSIGTVTVATGPAKSVATTTEAAGKTITFTAIQITAGSVEDIRLRAIRFNQVGTIGTSDLANVAISVAGTVYPYVISADGKYYSATFGDGIVVTKGNNAEITIAGTLNGGTNRTIQFDVYRMTDIQVSGELYSFGINPTVGSGFTTTNPVYYSSNVTVGKATLNVEKDATISSQNIAVNVADQPLGGFTVEVKGEAISVAQLIFNVSPINVSTGATTNSAANITQIKLIGPDGKIVTGPVDGVAAGTVTFTDTVTFPIGKGAYKLVGKLGTTFDSNDTASASTTPATQWTTVRGVTTGDTITPTPGSSISGNTMTVKASALTINVSPTPVAQNVVSGVQKFLFATYQLDASQSGEDLRMISIPLEYNVGAGGSASNLTSCQLYDGVNPDLTPRSITTGNNTVNPTAAASSTVVTFDGNGLIIPKGTVKNIDMKCNIAGGSTGTYQWGYDSASSPSATGLTSGQSITPSENDNFGSKMTALSSGSYVVTNNSTPGYGLVTSGQTGVILALLKFTANDEDVDIQRVGFALNGVASNTPIDLVNTQLNLYDQNAPTVLLATAQFTNNGDFATSSLLATGSFRIPKGSSRNLIVKGDIAAITNNGPLVRSGDYFRVDYDGDARGTNGGNYGIGASSGQTITPTSSDVPNDANVGVRIFRAYPQLASYAPSSSLLVNSSNFNLYRFSVTAVGGDVYLDKLTFNISSTTPGGNNGGAGTHATTSLYSLYAFTDSAFSQADTTAPGNGTAAGLINGGQCYGNSDGNFVSATTIGVAGANDIEIFPASACGSGTTTYKVPAGVTRYFGFNANIASVETAGSQTDTIQVTVRGDGAFPTAHQSPKLGGVSSYVGDMGQSGTATSTVSKVGGSQDPVGATPVAYGIDADANDDFIWSPGSTSTAPTVFDFDFTNGYQLSGLPANDMAVQTFISAN